MSDAPIRVLIADDQTLVREGLVTLLGLIPGIEVAGVARDGEEAIALAARLRPDVVLMDLRMPRTDGVEATRRLAGAGPVPRVVVLTTYADDESVFTALQAGALGYLTKDSSADEIARAVRTVHAGQALLEPAVQRRLIDSLRERPGWRACANAPSCWEVSWRRARTTAGSASGSGSPPSRPPNKGLLSGFPEYGGGAGGCRRQHGQQSYHS